MASTRRLSSASSSASSHAAGKAPDLAPATRMLPDARFNLFLRVHSAQNLQSATQGTYCKLYLGDTIMVNGSQSALLQFNILQDNNKNKNRNSTEQQPTHRTFRTHVEFPAKPAHP
ncbi:hypothetical protein PybrP1_009853, partial [[Pythium] brassicae (nom. inval.)]